MHISPSCPLCSHSQITMYHQDKKRIYYQCSACLLVFVDPQQRLSAALEVQEYNLHQNSFEDAGYRRFLSRLAHPLLQALKVPSQGLDFGCGPTPLLARMLTEAGHTMDVYDPFFFNDPQVLCNDYGFITCSEAIEHFHDPSVELKLWDTILQPGGWLAVMTKRVIDQPRFADWHYKNDPTHVSFFSEHTFFVLGDLFQWDVHIVSDDVVLMQKQV